MSQQFYTFLKRIFKRRSKPILIVKFHWAVRNDTMEGYVSGLKHKLGYDYHILCVTSRLGDKDTHDDPVFQLLPSVSDTEFKRISDTMKDIYRKMLTNQKFEWTNIE